MSLLLLASALPSELTSQLDKMMRADLDTWSSLWFWVLVGSTVAVVIGIICEAPEVWQAIGLGRKTVRRMDDLNGWERLCPELLVRNDHPRKWIAAIGFLGWTFVALGVAGEGVAEYFVNDAETDIRSFDEASLSETTRTAGNARASAEIAAGAAGRAQVDSNRATASASTALSLADGARKEADSFEKDIVSAKTQAAEAESHLAEALRQAAAATEELNRLKMARSLVNAPALVSALEKFKVEYTFVGVFQDQESIDLLRRIDGALQLAGWTRVKRPEGGNVVDIEIKLFKDFGVPPTVLSGVIVEAQSPEKPEALNEKARSSLPGYIQAAAALKAGLAVGISPPQEDLKKPLGVSPGDSMTVFILVGKKP